MHTKKPLFFLNPHSPSLSLSQPEVHFKKEYNEVSWSYAMGRAGGCGVVFHFTLGQGCGPCDLNWNQDAKCHEVPGNTAMTWQCNAETHVKWEMGEEGEKHTDTI